MYTNSNKREYIYRGKKINAAFGTDSSKEYLNSLNFLPITLGSLPKQHEFRPDLVSFTFYNSAFYWEEIMLLNNFFDPFDSLKSGTLLKIGEVA